MSAFALDDHGVVTATLDELEIDLLRSLSQQVSELLRESVALPDDELLASFGIGGGESASLDPAVARLLPDAYANDPEAASEFRRLTENGLAQRKIDNARLLAADLDRADGAGAIALDAAAEQAWLRAVNDIRLVLASRLGLDGAAADDADSLDSTDELDSTDGLDSTDEEKTMMHDVFDWLGSVQDSLLAALESR